MFRQLRFETFCMGRPMTAIDMETVTLENQSAKVTFLPSLGAGITSYRFKDPKFGEIPLLMEQNPIRDAADTNWMMLPPGRSYDSETGRFGVVVIGGKEYWLGDPNDAGNQLNGIHGPFMGEKFSVSNHVSTGDNPSVTFEFDGANTPGFAERWPWPNLQIEVSYALQKGGTLSCEEKFIYSGEGSMPFSTGRHPFFPHWQDLLGDSVQGKNLPFLSMGANGVWEKRLVGSDEILLPVGPVESIGGTEWFNSPRQLPLGLDHCFSRVFGKDIGISYRGENAELSLVIKTSPEYSFGVVYSPPLDPEPSRFGAHFAVEWQTSMSNVFDVVRQPIAGTGFLELKSGVPQWGSWEIIPKLLAA